MKEVKALGLLIEQRPKGLGGKTKEFGLVYVEFHAAKHQKSAKQPEIWD